MDFACRTLLAVLVLRRPRPSTPKEQRETFKTLCAEVQVWLRDEIAEMRQVPQAKKATTRKGTHRVKVGHA